MDKTAGNAQRKATEEALNWLILLREDPGDGDARARFLLWLHAEDAHRAAWDEANRLWRVAGMAPRAVARRQMRRAVASGVAALALAVLAAVYVPGVVLRLEADHVTRVAETRQIRLADGSSVTLGGASAIAVEITPERRAVRLLAGEAWFEVAPDPARPFAAVAGDLHVTVLGTGFDLRLNGTGAAVAVGHGRVAVGGHEPPLEAGDWLYQAAGRVETGVAAPGAIGGWREGMLVVKDRPVSEVADMLGRYLPGGLTVIGGRFDAVRVTGVYDLARPEAALEALRAAHGGKLRRIPGGITIFSSY
ncbi:FecR family protein [Paenirhodobacter sp.]|uniref:FecR family protein n=1 Tax=Paenirhodobacter sp. TaxID=1965326 RepID=UPI003B3E93FC